MASLTTCVSVLLLLTVATSYSYPLINPSNYYYYLPNYPHLQAYQTVPTTLTTVGTAAAAAPTTPIVAATPPGTAATIPGLELTKIIEFFQNLVRIPQPAPAPAPSPSPSEAIYLQPAAPLYPQTQQSNPGYYTWGYVIPPQINAPGAQPQQQQQQQPQQQTKA